ncbi:zinc-finger homeodomain protein 5-like [Canna indica]|uniref:Zinc-finger homeodomain protein 5-like n=1 Tax=Canna indica TaxID=4628 RepID=A0AAQ3QPK6_9LILI|nr:zinc-finger homeodomain protein 5-like [Canna indica]
MEFRNPSELGMPSSPPGFNPSLIRAGSAFSKPTISPSSSLLSPRSGARNGDILGNTRPPPPALEVLTGTPTAMDQSPGAAAAAASISKPTAAKTSPAAADTVTTPSKYRECLRNHAAATGGHVVDGCGEFMPSGDPDTAEALACAACGCHRSFHRRDADAVGGSYYHATARQQLPLLLPPPPPHHLHHHHQKQFQFGGFSSLSSAVPVSSGFVHFGSGGSGGTTTESSSEDMLNAGAPPPSAVPRKRFRTKFTQEQKDKMLEFSEKVGWRIQRQDYAMVEQFCAEIGVRRQVLKVWMHNNKNTATKTKQPQQQQPQLLLPSPPPDEELLLQQRHQAPPLSQ